MQGASAIADRITTDIGGDLKIESLKDKITYDSQQTSVGGGVSICVPPICYGQMVAVTANAAESKIKADHDSVGANDEAAQRGQSGLKAGNGGFDIKVGGNTTLIGGVITSTDQAVNDNKNSFQAGGALTTQDIENHSELEAYSVSASLSTGSKGSSGSFGYGEVSDSQSSVTKAAISGIAGNQAVRTGDRETGIDSVFTQNDADKINTSLAVQTGITAEFGKNAAKAVGDIAASKMKPYQDATAYQDIRAKELNGEALSPAEQFQRAILVSDGMTDEKAQSNLANPELQQDYENWKEGGAYRVGLHIIAGAMGGGVNGAIGAGISATAAPLMDELQAKMEQSLIESGMNAETAKATAGLIAVGTAAAAGGIASGGIQGATTAANVDLNNRQLHPNERTLIAKLAKEKAKEQCQGNAQCDESRLTIAWTDALERAAENLVDDKKYTENMQYLSSLLQTTNDPRTEGAMGGADRYISDLQLAQTVLAPYMGQPITVNGVATEQTYFSATPEQRRDEYINYILGIDPPSPLVPGRELRDETRLENLSALNGSATKVYPIEELLLGGPVTNRAVGGVVRFVEQLDVALAGRVGASTGGNISARQITEEGFPVRLTASERAITSQIDSLASTTTQGQAREYVADSYFARNGFTPLEGKCGSGNCFDGVYIKGDKVYINEVKPLNADGSIKLSGPSGNVDTQMSPEWIKSAIRRLNEGTPAQKTTAAKLLQAIDNQTLIKIVTGVNSNGMTIVKLK